MLMAPSTVGDDVKPQDFRAFWFDGNHGFQIAPGVWHQSPYTLPPPAADGIAASSESVTSTKTTQGVTVFRNKQTSVFVCVLMDSVAEFGVYLEVPLHLNE
jgi:ureidoglycolate lyase